MSSSLIFNPSFFFSQLGTCQPHWTPSLLRRGKASRRGLYFFPFLRPELDSGSAISLLELELTSVLLLVRFPSSDPYLRIHATGQRRGSSCPNLQHLRSPNEPLRRTSRFQLVRLTRFIASLALVEASADLFSIRFASRSTASSRPSRVRT